MASSTCPVCHEAGAVELRGPREATVGSVAVLLERAPVVVCPSNHAATPPEFVDAAMRATDQSLKRARRRLLRGDACSNCGAELVMPVRRTRRSVTVEPPDHGPVLTLTFDLPASRCPACGSDEVPTRSHEDLVVSVPAVFTGDERT